MAPFWMNLYLVLQWTAFILCGLATLYIFIFSIAGLLYHPSSYPCNPMLKKIVVLIPGYKEDEVILDVAEDALKQDYPADRYDVVIIADSFSPVTLERLRALPIRVVEVQFEKSTKSKALNKAMAGLEGPYDLAVVLDADNLMAPDFLSKINAAFEQDFKAVQGHRTAKNMNTPLALLDAASEEINNHIFRKGHRALLFSSAIIGSGMAFRYDYFKKLMAGVQAVGGFDKEIELKMLKAGHVIEYLDDACVYDEKVQKEEVFSNQRRRWLAAQFHYFLQDFPSAFWQLIRHGNIDYFDKAVQFIQPPRVLLLGADLLLGLLFIVLNSITNTMTGWNFPWILLMLSCLLTFLFALPQSFYNKKTLKALLSLPKGMLLMLGSLLHIKGANKQFIHTQHTSVKSDKTNQQS